MLLLLLLLLFVCAVKLLVIRHFSHLLGIQILRLLKLLLGIHRVELGLIGARLIDIDAQTNILVILQQLLLLLLLLLKLVVILLAVFSRMMQ